MREKEVIRVKRACQVTPRNKTKVKGWKLKEVATHQNVEREVKL